jgi:hypothetical protein
MLDSSRRRAPEGLSTVSEISLSPAAKILSVAVLLPLLLGSSCGTRAGRTVSGQLDPAPLSEAEVSQLGQLLSAQIGSSTSSRVATQVTGGTTTTQRTQTRRSFGLNSPSANGTFNCSGGGTLKILDGALTYSNCLEGTVTKNGTLKFEYLQSSSSSEGSWGGSSTITFDQYREARTGSCGAFQVTQNGWQKMKQTTVGSLTGSGPFTLQLSGSLATTADTQSTQAIRKFSVEGAYQLDSTITLAENTTQTLSYRADLVVNGGSVRIEASGTLISHEGCTSSSPTSTLTYQIIAATTSTFELKMHCQSGTKSYLNGVELDPSCI